MSLPPPPHSGPARSRPARLLYLVTRWAALGLALVATASLSGYLSMRKAVRGGEVTVPSLIDLNVSDGEARLKRSGLILEKSGERTDPVVPAGSIVSQDPPEGSRLKRNRKVRVLVSLGKEVLAVPELVGQPARRAQIGLQQSGLKIGQLAYVSSDRSDADRILAQEPPAGSQRMREGEVDLLVSKGSRPKVWVMPRVEGIDLGTATRLFNKEGLRVTNVRREASPAGLAPGIILQQMPPSGYPLREGDSISLVVSGGGDDHE
jgi:eukaryotic-like serine/threonine-protein kinase